MKGEGRGVRGLREGYVRVACVVISWLVYCVFTTARHCASLYVIAMPSPLCLHHRPPTTDHRVLLTSDGPLGNTLSATLVETKKLNGMNHTIITRNDIV